MKGILFIALLACAFCADKHFPAFVECLGKNGKSKLVEAIHDKNIITIGKIVKDELFAGDLTILKCFPFKIKEFEVEGDEDKPDYDTKDLQLTDQQIRTTIECLKAIGSGTDCYLAIAELVMTKNVLKVPGVILLCSDPAMDIVVDCLIPIYNGIKKVVQDAKKKRK